MRKNSGRVLIAVLIAGAAGAYCYWKSSQEPTRSAPVQPTLETKKVSVPAAPSVSHFPVPTEKSQSPTDKLSKTLPPVDNSDLSIQGALIQLFDGTKLSTLINLDHLVRRIVISVDNATEVHPYAADASVFAPPKGVFQVTGGPNNLSISSKNYARYQPYIYLLKTANLKKLVAVYIHYYPLFQAAYQDLKPHGYFNDRLIEVIDNMIAAPDMNDPVLLTLDSVYYKYSNPELESCSSAQKILLRIGPKNAKLVKENLRKTRELLTHLKNN